MQSRRRCTAFMQPADTHTTHASRRRPPAPAFTAASPPPVPPACLPAALSNQESLKERKLGALHQALAMYQQRLGLEFQHGEEDGEQLRVVMRQLDPRDHARPFQFAVQVVGDNSYAGAGVGRLGRGGLGCSTLRRWTGGRRARRLESWHHAFGRLCC